MSNEASLNFLIPEISCQQDFEIVGLYADGAREKVLNCEWSDTDYYCSRVPGLIHKIENDHTIITVQKELREKFETFICVVLGQPLINPSSCLCRQEENYKGTSEGFLNATFTTITRGEPDSDHHLPNIPLITGLCVGGFLLILLMVLIIIYHKRIQEWCRKEKPITPSPGDGKKPDDPLPSPSDGNKPDDPLLDLTSPHPSQPLKHSSGEHAVDLPVRVPSDWVDFRQPLLSPSDGNKPDDPLLHSSGEHAVDLPVRVPSDWVDFRQPLQGPGDRDGTNEPPQYLPWPDPSQPLKEKNKITIS